MKTPPLKTKIEKNIERTREKISLFESRCKALDNFTQVLENRNMPLTKLEDHQLEGFVKETIQCAEIVENLLKRLKNDFTTYTKTAHARQPSEYASLLRIVRSINALEVAYYEVDLPKNPQEIIQ